MEKHCWYREHPIGDDDVLRYERNRVGITGAADKEHIERRGWGLSFLVLRSGKLNGAEARPIETAS